MKRFKRIELAAYAALFLATAGNVGFHYLKGSAGTVEAKPASGLVLGSVLPVLRLQPLSHPGGAPASATAALPTGCRVLVVFHPDCPHCHAAARREAQARAVSGAGRLPVVWISGYDDPKARDFEAHAAAGMPVRFDPDAPRSLKATAVPVYVLAGPDGRVKFWGAFTGQENHAELRRRC